MNQTTIRNALWECQKIVDRERMSENKEYYRYLQVLMALERHISTGRACSAWLKKFISADKDALMEFAAWDSGSEDVCLAAIIEFFDEDKYVSFENTYNTIDENGNKAIYIDGYPANEDLPGTVIAVVYLTPHGDFVVDYHHNEYREHPTVSELIKDAKERLLCDG